MCDILELWTREGAFLDLEGDYTPVDILHAKRFTSIEHLKGDLNESSS